MLTDETELLCGLEALVYPSLPETPLLIEVGSHTMESMI